ncbi:farnesol dehydrogenase-like [Myzus persicae]|uniref:farnesol dehydrogenase-like n=1 Tax=Myzus persicae TaxID=13164 RepID=UPI000B93880A|nr:farnesol dehydrogenase-like [Myzus persicae]XP_022183730.1 farnesol dehydrogenase-like [Myzus persicae]
MEQWRGKVAIVTGASAGIGAAIVVKLAENGVHVVALARREHLLKELAESLTDKNYGTIYTKVCDVTNEQAVKDVFSWVDSTLGGPSILINNAGVSKLSSLLNGKLEDWQEILNLNVLALSVCSREAYKSMTKNKIDGHIIQINSISGHSSTPNFAYKMYNASKQAVTTLCDGLRHELQLTGSKIKVSSVSPGPTATDMLSNIIKYAKDITTSADFKILDAEDVANGVIASLATPPNVLIAEMTIIPTGFTVQMHFQPSSQVVENSLSS